VTLPVGFWLGVLYRGFPGRPKVRISISEIDAHEIALGPLDSFVHGQFTDWHAPKLREAHRLAFGGRRRE
jgi:hypothetical protein